jgi:hypothetical protein
MNRAREKPLGELARARVVLAEIRRLCVTSKPSWALLEQIALYACAGEARGEALFGKIFGEGGGRE